MACPQCYLFSLISFAFPPLRSPLQPHWPLCYFCNIPSMYLLQDLCTGVPSGGNTLPRYPQGSHLHPLCSPSNFCECFSGRSLSTLFKIVPHPSTPSVPSPLFPLSDKLLYLATPSPTSADPTHPSKPTRMLQLKQSRPRCVRCFTIRM